MSKPLLCRLGFHQTFTDSIHTRISDPDDPVQAFTFESYETCDRCGWTTAPKSEESA